VTHPAPPPPAHPAPARDVLRSIPWLRVILAFASAFAVGLVTAWIIQATGTWLDGAGWEHRLLAFAQTTVSTVLDPLFFLLPFIGTNYTLLPFVVAVALYLWWRGEHMTSVHLVVVQIGSLLLNVGLKTVLARPRPVDYNPRGQHGLAAYPSGHSMAVTSVLITVAWLIHRHGKGTWGYWVVGFIFIANNWSRIYLGVHWPTDVIGGVLVGGVWLIGTLMIFAPLHRKFGEP
jgi:undecaprenyl-diphosphatase